MFALLVALALAGGGGADEPGALAYTRSDKREQQVWRMRADGGERVLLARNASDPAWSADGRRLAFVREGAIWTMDAGGAGQRRLTAVLGDAARDASPAWSPDGRSLAFTRVGVRDGPSHYAIWVMSADGSSAHPIVEGSSSIRVSAPAWSPGGELIAFTRAVTGRGGARNDSAIYTVRTDGSDPRRLSGQGSRDSAPAWSPDGSRIAYLGLGDRNGRSCAERCSPHAELYLMRADGSGVARLTRTRADEGRPAWSDDGAAMVFDQRPPGGVSRLVALLVDAGCTASLREARDRGERLHQLSWQPASGTARLRCDQPLAPARATFVGIAPAAVATVIRGGRAPERALVRRLVAGLGSRTGIDAVRIARPPAGRRATARPSIWLRFDLAGRGGRSRVSAVPRAWEAGLVADAYQRAAAAGLAPRPLLGHTLRFAGGMATALPQARRHAHAPDPNEQLGVSLIASEVAASSLPGGVGIEKLSFVRHHDQSAVRLVLRIDDPTSFGGFRDLHAATLGRLQLDQGGLVEFRDRCGRLVAAIATGVDGAPGELRVARGWSCPRPIGTGDHATCPSRKPQPAC